MKALALVAILLMASANSVSFTNPDGHQSASNGGATSNMPLPRCFPHCD